MSLLGALLLSAAASTHVPFVGCAADGQVGLLAPPPARRMPAVPASAAGALAWYVSEHDAVLAPRGWRCFETYGSNGGTLVVAPQPLSFDLIQGRRVSFRGPIVLSGTSFGGTSGRWSVAATIGRYFPHYRSFIREIRNMDWEISAQEPPAPNGPYPGDHIVSRTPTEIRLITPPGRRGEGTNFLLAPNRDPVETLIILHPEEDMDVSSFTVRLPRAQAWLGRVILADARRRALGH